MKENSNRVEKERWYKIVHQVVEGYNSLVTLSQIEKESIVCVMKNIELLFTAYFLSIGDEELAKDSADLFLFVKKNETKILDAILNI